MAGDSGGVLGNKVAVGEGGAKTLDKKRARLLVPVEVSQDQVETAVVTGSTRARVAEFSATAFGVLSSTWCGLPPASVVALVWRSLRFLDYRDQCFSRSSRVGGY